MALLNEILGVCSVDESDFSQEWTEVFGETAEGTITASTGSAETQQKENSFFLPSQLLDQSSGSGQKRGVHETVLVRVRHTVF